MGDRQILDMAGGAQKEQRSGIHKAFLGSLRAVWVTRGMVVVATMVT